MQFITKNKSLNKINIEHDSKMIIQINFVKFLGIRVDNTLSWKQHIDRITLKLNNACYTIRRSKWYLSHGVICLFSLSNVLWSDFFWKIQLTVIVNSNYRRELLE
jgi:hypothetical protein